MTREIEFRAWDKKYKYMTAEVSFIHIKEGFTGLFGETKIIMQYTGLKDKNGKKIFEGDIIIISDKNDKKIPKAEQVIWSHKGFLIKSSIYNIGIHSSREREIIGNIYENPELLDKTD